MPWVKGGSLGGQGFGDVKKRVKGADDVQPTRLWAGSAGGILGWGWGAYGPDFCSPAHHGPRIETGRTKFVAEPCGSPGVVSWPHKTAGSSPPSLFGQVRLFSPVKCLGANIGKARHAWTPSHSEYRTRLSPLRPCRLCQLSESFPPSLGGIKHNAAAPRRQRKIQ